MSVTQADRDGIRTKREARDWTQQELARRAGVTNGTISNLESGRTKQPRRVVWAKVMRALGEPDAPTPRDDASKAVFVSIVEDMADLDVADMEVIRALSSSLRKRAK